MPSARRMNNNKLMVALKLMLIIPTSSVFTLGEKSAECKEGFYGNGCAYRCSNTCRNNKCRTSEVGTSSCTDGCIDGYRGDSCRSKCPPFCIKCQRYKTAQCLQCRPFHYGLSCESSCRETCLVSGCDTKGTCLQYNAKEMCGENCKDCNTRLRMCQLCEIGFHGQKCESSCNEQCKESVCDRDSGQCVKGCEDGYHGKACTMECSKYCAHSICQRYNGDCTNGCSDGRFGLDCQQTCEADCAVCNRNSGECIITLSTTETGNSTYQRVQGPYTTYLYYIVGGIAFVVILILGTVSIICSCRFCRNNEKGRMTKKQTKRKYIEAPKESNTEFNAYSEINEDGLHRRGRLWVRHNKPGLHHLPVSDGLSPSAPPCEGAKRASTIRPDDQMKRSINVSRWPSVVRKSEFAEKEDHDKDTDDVVSELKLLTSQADYMKMCTASEERDQIVPQKGEIQEYLSAVGK